MKTALGSVLFVVWVDGAFAYRDTVRQTLHQGDYWVADPSAAWSILIGIVAVLIIMRGRRAAEKRQESSSRLDEIASSMGFSAQLTGRVPDQVATSNLELDPEVIGSFGSVANNLMHGEKKGIHICVFDREEENEELEEVTTKALFLSPDMDLPRFCLRPNSKITLGINKSDIMLSINKIFEEPSIDFLNYPEFSQEYHLTGDEDGIRVIFTGHVIEYFMEHRGWSVEGYGQLLLVYRCNQKRDIEDYPVFLAEGFDVFMMFS